MRGPAAAAHVVTGGGDDSGERRRLTVAFTLRHHHLHPPHHHRAYTHQQSLSVCVRAACRRHTMAAVSEPEFIWINSGSLCLFGGRRFVCLLSLLHLQSDWLLVIWISCDVMFVFDLREQRGGR